MLLSEMCNLAVFYLQPGLAGDYSVSDLDEISASQLSDFSGHRVGLAAAPVFELVENDDSRSNQNVIPVFDRNEIGIPVSERANQR